MSFPITTKPVINDLCSDVLFLEHEIQSLEDLQYLQDESVCAEIGLSAVERIKLRKFISTSSSSHQLSSECERAKDRSERHEGMLQR